MIKFKKYRKKPVVVAAYKWEGIPLSSIDLNNISATLNPNSNSLIIHTLEGDMLVKDGDYIIQGVKGEFYACRPDIFELTYEEISGFEQLNQKPK